MFYLWRDFSVQADVAAYICRLKAGVVVDTCYGTGGDFDINVFVNKTFIDG